MLTPEQIEEISFGTAKIGGYVKQDVDELLEPLTVDYITLYKENAQLKSKMKVLVTKLEEYRTAEASVKEAVVSAQKSCDAMVAEAEAKCAAMLENAGVAVKETAATANAFIQAENERVEEARLFAARQITELQSQLESCIRLLGEIKENHRPANPPQETPVDSAATADAVADEIAANLEALVGLAEDPAIGNTLPPLDTDSVANKFANLQFGKNYDPSRH